MHPLFPDHAGMSTSAFAQRNPPRSLWLQLVHRTGCLTRRARPLKPTSFLYKSNRCSRGRQDAIDFVTIALPSLRSLRHLHRRVSSLCYVTRFADENNSSPSAHLYCSSSAALIGSPPCGSNYVCESADSVYMMTENSRYILFQTSQTKNGR